MAFLQAVVLSLARWAEEETADEQRPASDRLGLFGWLGDKQAFFPGLGLMLNLISPWTTRGAASTPDSSNLGLIFTSDSVFFIEITPYLRPTRSDTPKKNHRPQSHPRWRPYA